MDEQIKERLANTKYICHANSYEQQMLWETFSAEGLKLTKYETSGEPVVWEEGRTGYLLEIGKIENRPLCICIMWSVLNGQDVLFIDYTSQLCDYKVLDEWVKENCPNLVRQENANNFHNIANYLDKE